MTIKLTNVLPSITLKISKYEMYGYLLHFDSNGINIFEFTKFLTKVSTSTLATRWETFVILIGSSLSKNFGS